MQHIRDALLGIPRPGFYLGRDGEKRVWLADVLAVDYNLHGAPPVVRLALCVGNREAWENYVSFAGFGFDRVNAVLVEHRETSVVEVEMCSVELVSLSYDTTRFDLPRIALRWESTVDTSTPYSYFEKGGA